jgi:hypothetical protein
MSFKKAVLTGSLLWVVFIAGMHAWLNLSIFRKMESGEHSFKVGFLPVT